MLYIRCIVGTKYAYGTTEKTVQHKTTEVGNQGGTEVVGRRKEGIALEVQGMETRIFLMERNKPRIFMITLLKKSMAYKNSEAINFR